MIVTDWDCDTFEFLIGHDHIISDVGNKSQLHIDKILQLQK